MPVYLLHGFRWSREGISGIRVRTIINDLEDVSADYIQNTQSQAGLLASFRKEYPEIMKSLPNLTLLEQYDPEDVTSEVATCQPYAFVGDKVVTIAGGGPNTIQRPLSGVIQDGSKMPATHGAHKTASGEIRGKAMSPSPRSRDTALSVNVEDVMASGPGTSPQAWEALADLRDQIASGEKIGWFVVYNGDPERKFDRDEDDSEDDDDTVDGNTTAKTTPGNENDLSTATSRSSGKQTSLPVREQEGRALGTTASTTAERSLPREQMKEKVTYKSPGFKKLFGKKEKSSS